MEEAGKVGFPFGGSTRQKIEDFFSTELPDPIVVENGLEIDLKDRKGIEKLVHERPPFLCIDKAILIDGSGKRIISIASVTIEMCEGHFPSPKTSAFLKNVTADSPMASYMESMAQRL
jgi:hypothetical protein